jgi:hypothetical protein
MPFLNFRAFFCVVLKALKVENQIQKVIVGYPKGVPMTFFGGQCELPNYNVCYTSIN